MCGFVGVVGTGVSRFRDRLERAVTGMKHRGPDDHGVFADDNCLLGFCRLSILDLTQGHQPMQGPDGSVIVYNGEVYNYRELADGFSDLRTSGDTEVVLRSLIRDGTEALPRFDGMFSLAWWDGRRCFLARDRLGIKPLYYARLDDAWVFASDIRALLTLGVPPAPHFPALDTHTSFLWNHGPDTAFAGVRRVLPGQWLAFEQDGRTSEGRYWRLGPSAEPDASNRATVDELRDAVFADVERQLVSDVPVGVFLSGGVDSSFVACALPEGQVKRAYTMSFAPKDLERDIIMDETRWAHQVARAHGLELIEVPLSFSPELFLDTVRALEEPVGDPAAISTRVLCARAEEKVLLSGMGGDELWGGYPRMRALELSRRLPGFTRPVARWLQRILPHAGRLGRAARNLAKLSTGAGLPWGARHTRYLSYIAPDERQTLYTSEFLESLGHPAESPHERLTALRPPGDDDLDVSLRFDLEQFLPCHNLHYTDKASMRESKEVRVPLLGNRQLDLTQRFLSSEKRGKWPLKAAAEGVVPQAILTRKKAGFGAPVQGWLAGPLRPLVDEYLSASSVKRRGWFSPRAVAQLLDDERRGRAHRYLLLYELLTLEAWARTFLDGSPAA